MSQKINNAQKLIIGIASTLSIEVARRNGVFGYSKVTIPHNKDISQCKIMNMQFFSMWKFGFSHSTRTSFLPYKVYHARATDWLGNTPLPVDVTNSCWF